MEYRGVAAPPPPSPSTLGQVPVPGGLSGPYTPGSLPGGHGAGHGTPTEAYRALGPPLPPPLGSPLGSPLGHPAYGGLYFNSTMGLSPGSKHPGSPVTSSVLPPAKQPRTSSSLALSGGHTVPGPGPGAAGAGQPPPTSQASNGGSRSFAAALRNLAKQAVSPAEREREEEPSRQMSPKTRGPQPLSSPLAGVDSRKDGHHLADREPSRSGFQPYRPSEEPRSLSAHPPVAPPVGPPPFSIDPAAASVVYSPYHALYPAHLQQAYRLEEQLYLERCGMLRPPMYPSLPPSYSLYGLRYPPEVLPAHLGMLSPAMAAERLKLEEEHRLREQRLREEEKEKEREREREREREQREQREREKERKQEEERREKAKRSPRASPSHHDSTARRPPVVGFGVDPPASSSGLLTTQLATSFPPPQPPAYTYGPYFPQSYPTPLSSLSSFATSLTSTLTAPLSTPLISSHGSNVTPLACTQASATVSASITSPISAPVSTTARTFSSPTVIPSAACNNIHSIEGMSANSTGCTNSTSIVTSVSPSGLAVNITSKTPVSAPVNSPVSTPVNIPVIIPTSLPSLSPRSSPTTSTTSLGVNASAPTVISAVTVSHTTSSVGTLPAVTSAGASITTTISSCHSVPVSIPLTMLGNAYTSTLITTSFSASHTTSLSSMVTSSLVTPVITSVLMPTISMTSTVTSVSSLPFTGSSPTKSSSTLSVCPSSSENMSRVNVSVSDLQRLPHVVSPGTSAKFSGISNHSFSPVDSSPRTDPSASAQPLASSMLHNPPHLSSQPQHSLMRPFEESSNLSANIAKESQFEMKLTNETPHMQAPCQNSQSDSSSVVSSVTHTSSQVQAASAATTSVIMSTSKFLPTNSTSLAAALTIGNLLSSKPGNDNQSCDGFPSCPRVSTIVSPVSSSAAVTPSALQAESGYETTTSASTAPLRNDALNGNMESATENESSSEDPVKPPNAIVKQLHQLTALSLLQSSQPVNHSKNTVHRIYHFQKKENVISRLDQVERRRREMQQKRFETRSRQKQRRFLKHRARQDILHRRDQAAGILPAIPSIPVTSMSGSNGLNLEGAALSDESDSESEEWWDDPKLDLLVTSGPPDPLDASMEKLDFLGYFGLTTLDRRKCLELKRLLKGNGITSALLVDDGSEWEKEILQLPLPEHSPDVVCGGTDYSGKVHFLRELDLKATTRRERDESEMFWLASEAERSRRGSNCKITKYLVSYRDALKKVMNRSKRSSMPAMVYRDFTKVIPSRHSGPSICDKLLGLSFSRVNGVSSSSAQSYLPLVRSALPCVLDVVLPSMLQSNGGPPGSDSDSSIEDVHEKEEDETEWPGIEAIISSYVNYHKKTNIEISVLRAHVSNLQSQLSSKNNEVYNLEQHLKDLTMMKTSQDVEHMRLQNSLDHLSGYLKGLKSNIRFKKPC